MSSTIAIILLGFAGLIYFIGSKPKSKKAPKDWDAKLTSPELKDMLNTPECPQKLIDNEIMRLRMKNGS